MLLHQVNINNTLEPRPSFSVFNSDVLPWTIRGPVALEIKQYSSIGSSFFVGSSSMKAMRFECRYERIHIMMNVDGKSNVVGDLCSHRKMPCCTASAGKFCVSQSFEIVLERIPYLINSLAVLAMQFFRRQIGRWPGGECALMFLTNTLCDRELQTKVNAHIPASALCWKLIAILVAVVAGKGVHSRHSMEARAPPIRTCQHSAFIGSMLVAGWRSSPFTRVFRSFPSHSFLALEA